MQRYFVNNINNNRIYLSKEDSFHVKTVMRMSLQDKIEVVHNHTLYLSEIIGLGEIVEAQIIDEIHEPQSAIPKVIIAQSLVKENKMDLILQKGTELGAYEFIPVSTKRSIIHLDEKEAQKKKIRWQKIVKEASEQSKKTHIPQVTSVLSVDKLCKVNADKKVLLSVNESSTSLKTILQDTSSCDTILIVIGPEGGFEETEEEALINSGFIRATLGNFVLRTETVGISILSMIQYEYQDTNR